MRFLPFACVFVLLALLLNHSWYGPDIWYHLTWGRGVIEHGQLWPEQRTLLQQPVEANVYWIFQSLVYLLYRAGGIVLASLLFCVTWIAIAVAWLRLSGALRHPLTGAWLFLMFTLCVQSRFEQRPEIFSYLFIMLTLLWFRQALERPPKRAEYIVLFVAQALWTNVHGYFALGVLIAAAYACAALFGSRENRRVAATALAVSAAATFATPFGFGVWRSVWENAQVGTGLRDLNAELFPVSFTPGYPPNLLFWCGWAVVAALTLRALYRRTHLFEAFCAAGGLILSAQAVRNMPLVFLLGAPVLSTLPVWNPGARLRLASGAASALTALALAGAVTTGLFHRATGGLSTFGIHLERASYPIEAVELLIKSGFKGKIFTDSYDGGYVEYHLPEARIAGDSYFSDPALTHEFFAAIRDPARLQALHRRFGFEALLINVENLEVMDAFLHDPGWALAHSDSHRALFFRRDLVSGGPVSLAQGTYYRGDDLRIEMYAFGPSAWMAIARKNRDRALLIKIASDLQSAPQVPAGLITRTLAYAVDTRDRELVQALRPLLGKTFETETGDRERLAKLDQLARGWAP